VRVFDGKTHQQEWQSGNIGAPGRRGLVAADIDNDGFQDIIVGGGTGDYQGNLYIFSQQSTLITLNSFTATPSDRKVILNWTTESEIDNAGFNIYRAEDEDGEYVKINNSLIPAEGSPTSGATYQFVDNDVKNRRTYYYKLEDIDLNGTSTMHGPVSATPRRVRSVE
jgi:hypothetical protein